MLYFDALITAVQRPSGVLRVGGKYLNSSWAKLQQTNHSHNYLMKLRFGLSD